MIAYPDASFLCALYRHQSNSNTAIRYATGMPEPLHVASPLVYEFRQSIRWQGYLHSKDHTKGFDKATGLAALAKLEKNMAAGALVMVPVEWADVMSIAERISAEYTWTKGCRGFDILHIATALHLDATVFLTFDSNQKKLAVAEGLVVPL